MEFKCNTYIKSVQNLKEINLVDVYFHDTRALTTFIATLDLSIIKELLPIIVRDIRFYSDKSEFEFKSLIGLGAYGKILLYQSKKTEECFVLKLTMDDNEVQMITHIKRKGVDCELLGVYYKFRISTTDRFCHLILCKAMVGDLYKFISKNEMSFDDKIRLMIDITEKVLCLQKYGLYYTDMKLQNVLYTCENGIIKTYLGDLGSIFFRGSKCIVTFIPFADRNNESITVSDSAIVWSLNATLLQLFKSAESLYYKNIKNYKDISELKKVVMSNLGKNVSNDNMNLVSPLVNRVFAGKINDVHQFLTELIKILDLSIFEQIISFK